MEKEGAVSTLVFHSKHLMFYSYSSALSSCRFMEENELDFSDVVGLRME